jgi:hypothetical protein
MGAGVRQTKWLPSTSTTNLPLHLGLDAISRSFSIYPFSQASIYTRVRKFVTNGYKK